MRRWSGNGELGESVWEKEGWWTQVTFKDHVSCSAFLDKFPDGPEGA